MIVTIAKRFTFDAAHSIPTMPDGHKCRRMHGHTYEVEIVLRGKVNKETGILLDYGEIAEHWQPLHNHLDHRTLNDISGLEIPTTENLVAWIFRWFYDINKALGALALWDSLHTIRIKESSTTWCEMSKVEYLAFCGELS